MINNMQPYSIMNNNIYSLLMQQNQLSMSSLSNNMQMVNSQNNNIDYNKLYETLNWSQKMNELGTKMENLYTSAFYLLNKKNETVLNLQNNINKSVTSDNQNILTKLIGDSPIGKFQLTVNQLATGQVVKTQQFSDVNSPLNKEMSFKINGELFVVDKSQSVTNIKDMINGRNMNVTASIDNNQLVLTSKDVGSGSMINIEGANVSSSYQTTNPNVATMSQLYSDTTWFKTINVTNLAKAEQIESDIQANSTSPMNLAGQFNINGKVISITDSMNLNDIKNQINNASAGVTASINNNNQLIITSNTTGLIGDFTMQDLTNESSSVTSSQNNVASITSASLGSNYSHTISVQQLAVTSGPQQNRHGAIYTVDGVQYTSSTNNIQLEGSSIQLNSTGDATIMGTKTNAVLNDLGFLSNGTFKNVTQQAQDASYSVDGTTYTSSSNDVLLKDQNGNNLATLTLNGLGTTNISNNQSYVDYTFLNMIQSKTSGQDALYQINNGANIQSSSNEITYNNIDITFKGLVQNANIEVKSQTANIDNVNPVTTKTYNDIVDFIGKINDSTLFLNQNKNYIKQSVSNDIERIMTNKSNDLKNIGITKDSQGLWSVDKAKLESAIEANADTVNRVFYDNINSVTKMIEQYGIKITKNPFYFAKSPNFMSNINSSTNLYNYYGSNLGSIINGYY